MVGGVRVGVGAGRLAGGRGDQRRRAAARDGRPRRATRGDPSGQAVERHGVGARRGVVDRAAAGRPAGVGRGVRCRCRWRASRSPSWRGCARNEPEAFARLAHVVLPHDWLTFRLTGSLTTDRGDASGTGYWSAASGSYRADLLALVDADRDWSGRRAHRARPAATWRASGTERSSDQGRATTWPARSASGCVPATWPCRSGRRERSTRCATRRRPTRRASSPASPTPPGGTCRWCARSTPPRSPTPSPGCSASTTRRSTSWCSPPPPGAGGLTLLPYLDGERTPDRPSATGVLSGMRSDVSREQLARAAVEGVVCGLLDGLDALGGVRPGRRPADPRRRWRSFTGLPPGPRRPQWAGGARAAGRGAGRHRSVRAGRRRGHRRRPQRRRRPLEARRRRRRRARPGERRRPTTSVLPTRRCETRLVSPACRSLSRPLTTSAEAGCHALTT